jgi:hypothetical protein
MTQSMVGMAPASNSFFRKGRTDQACMNKGDEGMDITVVGWHIM